MDPCFVDVTVEFLGVAFHNILYYTDVYPKSIFEPRRKYSIVVYHSIHPEVNQYIDLCLKSAAECLRSGRLNRVEMGITNDVYEYLLKFVFNFDKENDKLETIDSYLVQCEQNLRAFLLNLVAASNKFTNLPENKSFLIKLHTDESMAVAISTNPDFEEFPLVEVEEKGEELDKIIPLRRFPIRNYYLDTFIEIS